MPPKNSHRGSIRSLTKPKFKITLWIVIVLGLLGVATVVIGWGVRDLSIRRHPDQETAVTPPIIPQNTGVISDVSLFLLQKNLRPDNIIISNNDVSFNIADMAVLLPLSDLDNQLPVLTQIIDKYKALNKHLRKVDLRFHDPIVTY